VPVIAWSREPVDPVQFCSLVRHTLAGEGLHNLPRQVLRYRLNAMKKVGTARGESDFAPEIGVFFDDAGRVPGSFQRPVKLQAPS
jgi:hypothetical protein